ncbi:cytochrome P450 [Rhizorhabdus wittichii]|uniref:Cytochrome P450 n=1 Tax=Rhizorhabdus wittichii TaxID=160791 RepID=A0A975HDW5_9SPHN|nr:cytochrome P450 [Rhizorhabdus wittichii]QTH20159.1 cytochrome P450 [Rhizorhabdus wittichii]
MSISVHDYDPLDIAVIENPYPYYAQLRTTTPVHWIESVKGYAVSRWDDVQTVLRDVGTYSSMGFWPELLGPFDPVPEVLPMISLDPPRHTVIRKLANKAFTPKLVNALEARFRQIANSLIDDLVSSHGPSGRFDFVERYSGLFPVSVISELLGVDVDRRQEFKTWADDILSASNRAGFSAARAAEVQASKSAIRSYFEELHDRRSAAPGDDMFSSFIHAEIDGQKLSPEEAINLGVLLLIGGIETTTNLIGNTVAHFGGFGRSNALDLLPDLLPLIDEMLRLEAPTQLLFRHTTRDTHLASFHIPKGSLVMPLLGSANRDDRKFEDPDRFILKRAPRDNLTFGQGPHACVGSYLSRIEAKVALEVLVNRFERLEVVEKSRSWIHSFFARGPRALATSYLAAADGDLVRAAH